VTSGAIDRWWGGARAAVWRTPRAVGRRSANGRFRRRVPLPDEWGRSGSIAAA